MNAITFDITKFSTTKVVITNALFDNNKFNLLSFYGFSANMNTEKSALFENITVQNYVFKFDCRLINLQAYVSTNLDETIEFRNLYFRNIYSELDGTLMLINMQIPQPIKFYNFT